MLASVPDTGTLMVNPVVARLVAKGVPAVAALAEGVSEQLVGVTGIGVAKVTATEVADEMLHVPERVEVWFACARPAP